MPQNERIIRKHCNFNTNINTNFILQSTVAFNTHILIGALGPLRQDHDLFFTLDAPDRLTDIFDQLSLSPIKAVIKEKARKIFSKFPWITVQVSLTDIKAKEQTGPE